MAAIRKQIAVAEREAIRQVLNRDWDPLRVNGDPIYDTCIPAVHKLLKEHASAEEIAECFFNLERTLGIPTNSKKHLLAMARKLQGIEFDNGDNAA